MHNKTAHFVSLGCAKNTVDTDSMAQLLVESGYEPVNNPEVASVVIVNTCGFINPAKEESIQILKELAAHKRKGQRLIAAGCLTQRLGAEIAQEVAGIDAILGTRRWMDIVDVVQNARSSESKQVHYHLPDTKTIGPDEEGIHRVSIRGASAYLKIADGCRRPCAFCAIPLIKGTAISRDVDSIIEDARILQKSGVKEIILIAQDTTDYGYDLGMKNGLTQLLEKLVEQVPEVDWLRLMYAYPGCVDESLIDIIAQHRQLLPYLDIPLQHAHPATLRRMRRPANIDWVYRTLERMRAVIPDLTIRTTFIVGYPGETEAEFQALLDFVKDIRFDRVGVFKYSFEPGTESEALGDPIPADVKQERYKRLMELQQGISLELNQQYIGKTIDVLVEGKGDLEDNESEGEHYQIISIGRSFRDAPEIDGMVLIEADLPTGEIVPVRITGAMPYDLSGVVVKDA